MVRVEKAITIFTLFSTICGGTQWRVALCLLAAGDFWLEMKILVD
jgi:hypothetical protein